MKKLKPLGNRVLIKREKSEQTKGGILLPDSAQEKPKLGEVIGVGPGKLKKDGKLEPMMIEVGNKVLFTTYAGNEVNLDDEHEYLVMSEEDVLAIVE